MQWQRIDIPGLGQVDFMVDDTVVKRLPSADEIWDWIGIVEEAVEGISLDPTSAWGHDDCDANGNAQDGDSAQSGADAVIGAIGSLLWGGISGVDEDHWCMSSRVTVFPYVEDNDEFDDPEAFYPLDLSIVDGEIVGTPINEKRQ